MKDLIIRGGFNIFSREIEEVLPASATTPTMTPRGQMSVSWVAASERPSRWSVVVAFAIMAGASQLVWLTYAPVTSVTANRFGVSDATVGWLANMFPLWYFVLAIPAGVILDRWFRPGLAAGAVLTAAGAALRLVGDSYGWALAGQLIVAIGQPLVLNAIPLVARKYLAEKDRATGIAVASAGMFVGMVAAFLLGALLPDAHQFTTLVALDTGIACASAVALLVAMRHPVRDLHERRSVGRATVRDTLADPLIRRLCLIVFMPFGTFDAITTFGQALLKPAGVSASTSSIMLVLTVLAGVISSAVVPIAAARRHRETRALVAGAAGATVSCALLALAPSVSMGFITLTSLGFLLLPALPIVLELLGRHAQDAEGAAAGVIWMSGNLGAVLVTAVVGWLVHTPEVALLVCGAATLFTLPLMRGLARPGMVELPEMTSA